MGITSLGVRLGVSPLVGKSWFWRGDVHRHLTHSCLPPFISPQLCIYQATTTAPTTTRPAALLRPLVVGTKIAITFIQPSYSIYYTGARATLEERESSVLHTPKE